MAEQDLIKRPLPDVIVPKDDGLYRIMKRLERTFYQIFHKELIQIFRKRMGLCLGLRESWQR